MTSEQVGSQRVDAPRLAYPQARGTVEPAKVALHSGRRPLLGLFGDGDEGNAWQLG